MLSLRAQRSNLVTSEASPPEIATSPEPAPGAAPSGAEGAPRNDEFSLVLDQEAGSGAAQEEHHATA